MASSTVDLWGAWQRERNEPAFEALVRPVLPALFDAARRSGLRSADAEDVVQDALTELAREPGERPGRIGIAPWLIRSVRLKAKMWLRSESRRRAREQAVARSEDARGEDAGGEDASGGPVRVEVERALDTLDENARQILLLRFLYDLEYREIAQVLGISAGACRIRVHRATRRLRRRLGPQVGALIAAQPLAPVPDAAAMLGQAVRAAGPATAAAASGGLFAGGGAVAALLLAAVVLVGAGILAMGLGGNGEEIRISREGAREDAASLDDDASTANRPDPDADDVRLRGSPEAGEARASASEAGVEGLPPYVVGRVRRADGHAAAGVEVRVLAFGLDAPSARTDAEGRYRVPVGPLDDHYPTTALVVARDGDEAGRTPVYVSAGRREELPARALIVLGPTYDLDVVVRQGGEPVPAARVVLAAIQEHGWSGMEEIRTDREGRVRFAGLPAGGYAVAASTGSDRARSTVAFSPDAGGIVALDLRPGTRTLHVTVLDGPTGEPIEGAQVELNELTRGIGSGSRYEPQPRIEPTDAEGRVVIEGLDTSARLQVAARAPGYAPSGPAGIVHRGSTHQHPRPLDPGQTEVVLRLSRPVPVSWSIEDGEVKRPADGTPVVLRADYGDAADDDLPAAQIEGGRLHADVSSGARFQAVAFLPDGAHASLSLDASGVPSRVIRFLKPRRAVVTLRYPGGAPAVGYRVQVGEFSPVFGPYGADAAGVVTFDGLPDHPLALYLLPPAGEAEAWGNLSPVTQVHGQGPGQGPARLELVVSPAREILLHLRLADRPLLPPDLGLGYRNLRLLWKSDGAQAGAVRFRVRPWKAGETVRVGGSASGFAGFSFDVPVETGDGDGPDPFEHAVELQRAGEAWLRTVPPPDGRTEIELQRYDPETSVWVRGGRPWWLAGRAARTRRWTGLLAGRHRFVDVKSGLATEFFEVTPGEPAPVVTLDLSRVVLLDGRVEVPLGYDPTRTRLQLEGRHGSARRGRDQLAGYGLRVRPDGTFQLRVVPDRTETLTISHPALAPASGSESVRVSGRTAGVILRLVERRIARFRLHPDALPLLTPDTLALPPKIRLYAGGPDAEPALEQEIRLVDGAARFGGFAPGTYTVWIDVPPFAPKVLPHIVLGDGQTDLGEVQLEEGLTVRLRVRPRQGGAVGLLNLQATAVEGPPYLRGILERKEHEITLRGLRPGKHRVQLFEGVQMLFDEVLDVQIPDGVFREVDLRNR